MISANFCINCSRQLKQGSYPHCAECDWVYYNNPRPTAGVFILNGRQVLLARRGIEPFKGELSCVGGYMEHGESPEETAMREAAEEASIRVRLERFLGVFKDTYAAPNERYSTVNIYYVGKIASGKPVAGDDVAELEWHDLFSLDIDRLNTFASVKLALTRLRQDLISKNAQVEPGNGSSAKRYRQVVKPAREGGLYQS